MGHITSKGYYDLQKRLDHFSQGAPESDVLYKILEVLFTEKEAELASKLPIKLFDAKTASKRWNKPVKESEKILNDLADKGILLDMQKGKKRIFVLAPTMAGFFEFSLMRTDGKFDRKVLSELFYQYINVEEDFIRMLIKRTVPIARTFVHENKIPEKYYSEILNYERATKVIETATCITVGTCYCRHKMEHVGKACDMPQDVCLTFNTAAESLSKHGIAKKISKKQAQKILDQCVKLGLVQIGDNIEEGVNWICNCCGCCCEALLGYKKLGHTAKIHSNFYAKINQDSCSRCKLCINKCPVNAITFNKSKHEVLIDFEKCIGCGVCVGPCPKKSIELIRRKKKNFVPKDGFERVVLNAIEDGKLQDYIFDNYDLWTNELLRKFLGAILKLSPAKFLLAQAQLKSRYLRAIVKK